MMITTRSTNVQRLEPTLNLVISADASVRFLKSEKSLRSKSTENNPLKVKEFLYKQEEFQMKYFLVL